MEPGKASSSSSAAASPAAAANARKVNAFAYQTKLLERSGSRSSTFSLANNSANPTDANGAALTPTRAPSTASGLQHSGSVRRYPAPHRHNASLDPARTADLLRGAGASPTQHTEFGSSNSLASSTSSAAAARSPNLSSGSFSTPPSSTRSNRHLSMPPAPRVDHNTSTTSTPTAAARRPISPTKTSSSSSPFSAAAAAARAGAVSPTKYERPISPTKQQPGGYNSTPTSPGKPADDSWIASSPSTPGGSFWSSSAGGASTAASSHAPSAIHLGGVSDLKRSSVGALQMMRDLTTRADATGAASGLEPGRTRMTVGPGRSALQRNDSIRGAESTDDDFHKPARPGRMESEDQGAGEIILPGITTGAEDVAGLPNRIRLARAGGLGTAALGRPSATTSSSLPFTNASKWMDTQRHLLQAYEYLCHCGEAKQWLEHCVGEELGDVVDMENEMRDGVFLAKLARTFEPDCVPRIFTHPKLQYRHTDNTNYFFRFVHKIGLPVSFHFELTDLYEKKNFPKVVYCIHALSHILARQGRAVKVGNLVGNLQFTDDQLQQTQRGLDAAGVSMPKFGALGKTLAKEMNVEPEPEPETEEERIDRELGENLSSVIATQTIVRGFLARGLCAKLRAEAEQRRREQEALRLEAERRAAIAAEQERQRIAEEERKRAEEQKRIAEEQRRLAELERQRIEEQQRREAEERRRVEEQARLAAEEKRRLEEQRRLEEERRAEEQRKLEEQRMLAAWAPTVQARIRGVLLRKRFFKDISTLDSHEVSVTGMQAQIRGALARQAYQDRIFQLADAMDDVIKLQTACRAALARRSLLGKIRSLRNSTDSIVLVQAQIRGLLVRRTRRQMAAALQKVEVHRAVGGLQSLARAALARRAHKEQRKELEFVAPDVVGVQSQIRGLLARREHQWWRSHILSSEPVAIHLQSLVRGLLAKRAYNAKLRHYHDHMEKVVKIQSLFRGKQQGEQYRSLTMGKNVPVSTIKNFGHLLNDSDHDFEDEIEVERLRKLVVRSIRENRTLENDVAELDTKIALLVKNKIGIEELIKAKNERGLLGQRDAAANLQRRNSVLVAAGDPFADQTLDRATRRKLELYQELFYALQTRPEYLARLCARVGKMEIPDRQRKQVEKIVLTLFGYAQKAREEFLLLKLFQRCVAEELTFAASVQEFKRGNAQFIKLVVQYNRGAKERQYLRDLLGPLVQGIVDDEVLDLETDPCTIYRATINQEEMDTGRASQRPLDVTFHEALADPAARTAFIQHLQFLRATTEQFLAAMIGSLRKMPFGIRYIAREVYRALQDKFPNESEEALISVVGHLVYYRYLNPAIVAPEGFDVIETLVGPVQRKNLAEVSKMLTQIAAGRLFSEDNPYLQPLNEYVSQASKRFTAWLFQVVDVQDAEVQFSADEFLDHAAQQRPVIYISPNEIYSMHLLVSQQVDHLAPSPEDPLRAVLVELGAPPVSSTQELNTARDSEITFELVSRTTLLVDPEAETKALFVETKRLVLSLLKVQSGKTLLDVFVAPVTDADELAWEELVSLEVAGDRQRQRGQRPPAPEVRSARLEDVRRLSFAELKARTLENMLQLEQLGKVSRANGYQEMLSALAVDIRNKHRKRIQRHNEKTAMNVTLKNLSEKKSYLEEQINSYNAYIDASMQTMQKKGRKKFVLPFTQQYFHMRSLKASGKIPKFGSYKYTAQRLFEKGVLISVDQFSQKQYDQINLTISSDEPGLFTVTASVLGVVGGTEDLRIEDLLSAQFSNVSVMSLMDGMAKVKLPLLINLINTKFYA